LNLGSSRKLAIIIYDCASFRELGKALPCPSNPGGCVYI